MLFSISLYISLAICILGIGYRIWTWFRLEIGPEAGRFSTSQRAVAAAKGLFSTLFSARINDVLRSLLYDALFQLRIKKENNLRWIMHMCIFWGFILLVIMHALVLRRTDHITETYPLFFRNLFGAVVFIGVGIAIYRRVKMKGMKQLTRGLDIYAIVMVGVIMVTVFFLETIKIVSAPIFFEMVQEHGKVDDHLGLRPLHVYWAKEFGSVFPGHQMIIEDEATLAEGKVMHEKLCADCHDKPSWAFLSYPVSRITKPVAANLAMFRADELLLPIHFLAVFIGLAYLPFSKFFHIFSSPVSLVVSEIMNDDTADPANIATRRAMQLDACTHCGTCSMRCSVGIVFDQMANINILPSEKLVALRHLVSGRELTAKELHTIQEGSYICTSCHRCT
ncbi:MAG: nitrate reductase, partial [Deltaproteobacteria bacterium]|nr:nitrate reductase [Deltaproteobacteria bacterium]